MCGIYDKGMSWGQLEGTFQSLKPVLFGERQPTSMEDIDAIKRIRLTLVATAARIYCSPRFRGPHCDPEMAANEFFVAIRAAKNSYKPDKHLHKYAYRVLSNVCNSVGRRARIRRMPRISPNAFSAVATPRELASQKEDCQRVRQALRVLKRSGKLSSTQFAAIVLKYYRGMSSKEAGESCGVSAATIDQRLHQARLILLKYLCVRRRRAS